jgi:hypothetical protein
MSNLDGRLEQASAEVRRHVQQVSLPPIREQRIRRRRIAVAIAVGVIAIAAVATPLVFLGKGGPGDSSGAETTATAPIAIVDLPESLVGSGAGWEFYVSQADGAVCYRIVSLPPDAGDTGDCRTPGEWSMPNVLHWGATWGIGDRAEVYGIASVAVARINIEFVHGPVAVVHLFESSTDSGFSGFYYRHNPDTDGIPMVISAYDSGGTLLGQIDIRDECPMIVQTSSDERLLEMCNESAE